MIRTTVTPTSQTVTIQVPPEYIGRELEVIAFANDEGDSQNNVPLPGILRERPVFYVAHVDPEIAANYRFDRDEANER